MVLREIHLLQQEVKRLHAAEKTVVWTNGCFDILHPGHIATFKKCKEIGDILVVGMNGKDSSYWKTKPGRPINDEDFRAAMLEAIRFVDIVYVFNDETPAPIVEVIHPDIVLKGGDYLSPAVSEMIAEKNMQIVHDGMLELTEVYRQMILGGGDSWRQEKGYMPEGEVVVRSGGKLVLLPIVAGYSTTSIIEKISC